MNLIFSLQLFLSLVLAILGAWWLIACTIILLKGGHTTIFTAMLWGVLPLAAGITLFASM